MKSKWKSTFIDLGTIQEKISTIVTFEALEELDISKVEAGCGCSKPLYIKSVNKVIVNYTPFEVPVHLRYQQGYYNPTQTITVYYKDGTTDSLSFTAKIIKK